MAIGAERVECSGTTATANTAPRTPRTHASRRRSRDFSHAGAHVCPGAAAGGGGDSPSAVPQRRAVVLRAVVFLAGAFLVAGRLAAGRVAVVFLAGAFLVAGRLAAGRVAVVFFAAVLRAGALEAVVLEAVVLRAVVVFLAAVVLVAVVLRAAAGAGGHTPRSSLGARLVLTTASLKPLSGVMRAFFDALMRTGCWVCGLRPMRAGRSTFTNLAKPEIDTGSPLATTAVTTSVKPLSTASTSLRSTPDWDDTACTRSRRFTGFS